MWYFAAMVRSADIVGVNRDGIIMAHGSGLGNTLRQREDTR